MLNVFGYTGFKQPVIYRKSHKRLLKCMCNIFLILESIISDICILQKRITSFWRKPQKIAMRNVEKRFLKLKTTFWHFWHFSVPNMCMHKTHIWAQNTHIYLWSTNVSTCECVNCTCVYTSICAMYNVCTGMHMYATHTLICMQSVYVQMWVWVYEV